MKKKNNFNKENIISFGKKYILTLGDIPEKEWRKIFKQDFQNIIFDKQLRTSVIGLILMHEPENEPMEYFTFIGIPGIKKRGLVIPSDHQKKLEKCPFTQSVIKYFSPHFIPSGKKKEGK